MPPAMRHVRNLQKVCKNYPHSATFSSPGERYKLRPKLVSNQIGPALLIAVVAVYGFSHTLDENLIRPALPRPFVLYLHVAVFSGWVLFVYPAVHAGANAQCGFASQARLVRRRAWDNDSRAGYLHRHHHGA